MVTRLKSVIAVLAAVMVVATAACMASSLAMEHFNRGFTYSESGEYENAIQEYDKAIQLDPNYAQAYSARGVAWGWLWEDQRAIQDFDKAIQLDPNYAQAYKDRGVAYLNLKQYQRAIQDYDKAIQIDPNYARAYISRGGAYRRLAQEASSSPDGAALMRRYNAKANADKAKACSLDSAILDLSKSRNC